MVSSKILISIANKTIQNVLEKHTKDTLKHKKRIQNDTEHI